MGILCREPTRAALLAALSGLLIVVALTLSYSSQALAQDVPDVNVEIDGSGAAEVNLDENTLGTVGDYSATASDGSTVTYNLTGDDAGDFYISNIEGDAGTVYNNRGFDFENLEDKELSFTVNASAGGSIPDSTNVTVTVVDKNDRPAFDADVFECTFNEGDRSGTNCPGEVRTSATDDDDDSLTYSLSGESLLAEYIEIDSATGEITLSEEGSGSLDFEARPEFKVSVRVSDRMDIDGTADDEIDDTAVIRVRVIDVALEKPFLTSQLVIDKHKSMRAVWTTDMATAQQYQLRYRAAGEIEWLNHDLTAEGALQQGAGYVYTKIEGLYADTEHEMQYCWNSPGQLGSCSTEVWLNGGTLTTQALSNARAAITGIPRPLSIAENVDPTATSADGLWMNSVGNIYVDSGSDDDASQNEMSYWLEGTGADKFTVESLNDRTIRIRTTTELDHEAKASYTLTLHVSDGRSATGAKDLSSDDSREITITVTDVVERAESPVLVSSAQGPNSVQLSWATPGAGDQTIAGYHIQYREVGDSGWGHTRRIVGNAVTIEHLQPSTAYEFRGLTTTTGRPSTWSDRDVAATLVVSTEAGTAGQSSTPRGSQSNSEPEPAKKSPDAPASPPAAPQNLTASATGGSVTLNWDAPDDGSITGYQVLRKLRGTRDLQVHVENTGSAAASYTDTDAEHGKQYVYRVKAINSAGVGAQSNYVRITTE